MRRTRAGCAARTGTCRWASRPSGGKAWWPARSSRAGRHPWQTELIRHGFEDHLLARIFAETMAVNAASRATMASVGMEYVRTFHLGWDDPVAGVEQGEVEYEITRGCWLARRQSYQDPDSDPLRTR